MNSCKKSTRSSRFGQFVLLAFALLLGTAPALAGNAEAIMTIDSDPGSASVSRDPINDVGGADFFVSYKVSITNPSNSSKNFRFVGLVNVTGGPAPTMFVSSRPDCVLTDPVRITCAKLEVARRTTVEFSVRFRTPVDGSQMELLGNLYFPVSSTSLAVSATATTTLVRLDEVDYTQGFNTYVPASTVPQTFFSGVNGNQATYPGGVATTRDPWTTTVVVPPINFNTRAEVVEGPNGSCVAPFTVDGCFRSALSIPGVFQSLTIYLRIDRTKIADPNGNIYTNQTLRYQADATPSKPNPPVITLSNCVAPNFVPSSGVPCIFDRKVFDMTTMPNLEWLGDWQYMIKALDNGRYFN